MAKYFIGKRVSPSFEYQENNTTISYQLSERWRNTGRSHEVSCKISSIIEGSHEVGTEITEIKVFNEHLESTLGIEGIASLKAHIEASSSIQFTLIKKDICKDIFNIPAPGCGTSYVTLYQFVRDFQFTTIKNRAFRKPLITTHSLCEFTKEYSLQFEFDPNHPVCPCNEIDTEKGSEILIFKIGIFSIRIDAFWNSKQQLVTKIGDNLLHIEHQELLNGSTTVKLEKLPKEFKEISGIQQDDVIAEVEIEQAVQLMDSDSQLQNYTNTIEDSVNAILQHSYQDKI